MPPWLAAFIGHTMMNVRHYGICVVVAVLAPCAVTFGSEYQELEDIAPESAEELAVGLDTTDEALRKRPRLGLLRDVLAKRSPFWRDSSLDGSVRIYDFQRESGVQPLGEAIAAGTELTFQSGKWRDRFSTTLSWHTSFGIDAPSDRGGTGLLGPDQSDLSVISRAYLEYDLGETTALRLYRQDFNMPYINRQDSRMIPNTFEAYMVRHPGQRIRWIVGHINKMKERDSEDFVPMAEVAGVPGDKSGTSIAGARYFFANEASLGAVVQHTSDLFTTAYSEFIYKRTISEDWGLQGAAQYTNQWSNGHEKIGNFNTHSWGLRGALSFRGAVLTAAYTNTGDFEIQKPFGGTPGFTSSMILDFDRANEDAYRIGLSQNFAKYGLPGTSLIVRYTKGRNAVSNDGAPLADSDEIAITVDFRPQEGLFEGVWLRVRYAEADRGSPEADRRDLRFILNYSVAAFQRR